jgi:hypothetical protein
MPVPCWDGQTDCCTTCASVGVSFGAVVGTWEDATVTGVDCDAAVGGGAAVGVNSVVVSAFPLVAAVVFVVAVPTVLVWPVVVTVDLVGACAVRLEDPQPLTTSKATPATAIAAGSCTGGQGTRRCVADT